MKQDDLVTKIALESGATKVSVKKMLSGLGVVVQQELKNGGEVVLSGIGKLSVKQRAARSGRNPATGNPMEISAKKVPHFGAAKPLKNIVRG
ncbi:MAG: HU family DNA-binding protein [Methylococcales bacterium]|nr:HU family DNA-binding protein [Methylococcales bacterium]